MDFIKKIVNEIFYQLKKFQHSFTYNYGYGRFFRILFTSCIHFGYGLLLLIVGRMTFKIFKYTAIPVNSIQSTVLRGEREPENSQKIGHVEHLEEREDKLVTSGYVESERIHQKDNLIAFVQVLVLKTNFLQFLQEIRLYYCEIRFYSCLAFQETITEFTDFGQEIRTDFGKFLQEIRKKRIERTGISKEIDLWNDFMEYLYWASNLPASPRYGSWFSLGDRLLIPFLEKDKFFDIYYPNRIKKLKDPSNFDPRKICPSKDSFSQGVLSLKAKFQPPIEIPLYPKEWSKTQGVSFESL